MTWRNPVAKFKRGVAFGVVDAEHPNGHRGDDLKGFPEGTPLLAVNDGTIVLNKFSEILGNVTVLKVDNAPWVKSTRSLYFGYCHMVKPSHIKVGTKVKSGDVIGYAGDTGFSFGVHLHITLALTLMGVFYGKVWSAMGYLGRRIKEQKKPVVKSKCCAGCTCKEGCK